jgi:hypothetical protein
MKRRAKIIAVLIIIAVIGGVSFFGYRIHQVLTVTVPDAYAVWNTASLINDYMDAHNGAWPTRWEDLRQTYESSNQPDPVHMADLQARVEVDWHADPRKLAAAAEPTTDVPPFRVIWLRDGSKAHWSGAEPNWLVWAHPQHTQPTTNPAATTQSTK